MFYGFVITEGGDRLLAATVAGSTLTITRVVMDKGTVESEAAARALTAPIDPGPEGTSTAPAAEENAVSLIVEYRSDLNGGLEEGFWIGGFAVYGRTDAAAETLLCYGSLGDAKQYVSAYSEGTAPDVRRYPVSIAVTAGVTVTLNYPAGALVTDEELEEALAGIDLSGYVKAAEKGVPGGVATLGQDGKLVQDVDGGTWDTEPVEAHNRTALAHTNLRVDGNSTAAEDGSATLEEHMHNPLAHQNLVIDGNTGK